jgi:hypothetical protein
MVEPFPEEAQALWVAFAGFRQLHYLGDNDFGQAVFGVAIELQDLANLTEGRAHGLHEARVHIGVSRKRHGRTHDMFAICKNPQRG